MNFSDDNKMGNYYMLVFGRFSIHSLIAGSFKTLFFTAIKFGRFSIRSFLSMKFMYSSRDTKYKSAQVSWKKRKLFECLKFHDDINKAIVYHAYESAVPLKFVKKTVEDFDK